MVAKLSLSPFDVPSATLAHFNRVAGSTSGQDKIFMVYACKSMCPLSIPPFTSLTVRTRGYRCRSCCHCRPEVSSIDEQDQARPRRKDRKIARRHLGRSSFVCSALLSRSARVAFPSLTFRVTSISCPGKVSSLRPLPDHSMGSVAQRSRDATERSSTLVDSTPPGLVNAPLLPSRAHL